jgi:predicted phosphodiesterase
VLRVAVVSDIHAYDHLSSGEATPSHLCTTLPEDQANHHPIIGLIKLIKDKPLTADVLICCGDMGDKARPAGIRYVWEKLHKIKEALKAKQLAATAGNHDVDSRYMYNDFDAKGVLQSLVPRFPLEDENSTNKFWSRNYVILTEQDYRLVILNSSAYHGTKEGEFQHGRITSRTVEALRSELEVFERHDPKQINILLCHHHPHKHGDIEDADYSIMEGAPKLLEVLGSGDYGNWIVIHGHKHHPRICYAAGSSSAPVIFSAGSLCAVLYAELQPFARNQFYLIEFPVSEQSSIGLGLIGTFQSWDWVKGPGWLTAGTRSGLPSYGGFGNRGDKIAIVNSIEAYVNGRGEPWVKWEEIIRDLPGLKYLLPNDLDAVIKRLEVDRKFSVLRDSDAQPAQVAKKL